MANKIKYKDKEIGSENSTLPEHVISAGDMNEIKNTVNTNAEELTTKANKVDGLVPLSELPPVHFAGMKGSGTLQDPYTFEGGSGSGISPEAFLKALPGYDVGKILYSDLTWGEIPSGSNLTKLVAPTLTIGTPAVDSIGFSWTAVFGATKYEIQRDTDIQFLTPVTVYNGSGLNQVDAGLAANTTYQYRFRVSGAGYSASDWVLYSAKTAATGNTTPAAPTNPVTNDTADTFGFTLVTGFALSGNYQYTLDGGATVNDVTTNPISVGNVAKAAGQVGVRVKAGTGRNASAWLFNTSAFTLTNITPAAPTNPVTDNITDTFDFTFVSGYTALSDYQITIDGGTTYSDLVAKPFYVGDVALAVGKVGVRVKAGTGRNASATLFNTVAFTKSVIDNSVPVTSFDTVNYNGGIRILDGSTNSVVYDKVKDAYDYGWGNYRTQLKLIEGATGQLIGRGKTLTADGLSASGIGKIVLKSTNDLVNNPVNSPDFFITYQQSNKTVMTKNSGNVTISGNATIDNVILRLRLTETLVYHEYSIDEGVTWTGVSATRPAGDLYAHVIVENAFGSTRNIHDLKQEGFVAV